MIAVEQVEVVVLGEAEAAIAPGFAKLGVGKLKLLACCGDLWIANRVDQVPLDGDNGIDLCIGTVRTSLAVAAAAAARGGAPSGVSGDELVEVSAGRLLYSGFGGRGGGVAAGGGGGGEDSGGVRRGGGAGAVDANGTGDRGGFR